jgi:hypothetical protein
MGFGFSAVGAVFGALGRFNLGAAPRRDCFTALLRGNVVLRESGGGFVVGSYGGGMVARSARTRGNGGARCSFVTV